MAGFNFGVFFGSGANNNSSNSISSFFSSINLSDYASIKNGSYLKLAKQYYGKDNTSKTDSTDTKKDTTKYDVKDTTGLSKMKKESDSVVSAVDELKKADLWASKDGKTDTEKIASSVKAFVDSYNNVISQSAKVTNSDVTKQVSNMQSMTSIMTKNLSKLGITVGTDGKLKLDEDTLKNASVKDIKTMFGTTNSYADQISKYANDAAKAAVNGSGLYSANGTINSTINGMFNNWV